MEEMTTHCSKDIHFSKLPNKKYKSSEKRLGRIDIYLIHWPTSKGFIEAWKALEHIYYEGRVKAIGVSNFLIHHLELLIKNSEVLPMINQIETHVYFMDLDTIDFCKRNNIAMEAWGPLIRTGNLFKNKYIKNLVEKYGKSTAQVVLRFLIQKDIIVLPKSIHFERLKENFSIFDSELNKNDIKFLESLNSGKRIGPFPDNLDIIEL